MNGPGSLNYPAPGMVGRNLLITVGLCTSVKPVNISLNVKVGATGLNKRLAGRVNDCILRERVRIEHRDFYILVHFANRFLLLAVDL